MLDNGWMDGWMDDLFLNGNNKQNRKQNKSANKVTVNMLRGNSMIGHYDAIVCVTDLGVIH